MTNTLAATGNLPTQNLEDFPSRTLLCPSLFQRLRKLCERRGGVRVANEGEHMTGNALIDAAGKSRWVVSTWGESYRINCPFCRDSRYRLWINYRFGQPDPVNLRQLGTFYGICFNEDCLRFSENRATLVDEIYGVHNRNDCFALNVEGDVGHTRRLIERPWPGDMVPMTQMQAVAPAVDYIVNERRFGFPTIEEFNLHYCSHSDQYPAAGGRIIAPIVQHGVMVGWQGRYIGKPPNKYTPKYYTMPGLAKRLILYNIDRVAGRPFVVVFEGITDVWRLPDYGVALLGKTMSMEQMGLLHTTFHDDQPIVLCLDPETFDNCAMRIREMIVAGRNPVIVVRLPDGYDPADFETNVLLQTIVAQASEAGITLRI
jgi:hypothetical protein